MTLRIIKCETCGTDRTETKCDGCGVDVAGMDDAVRIDIHLQGQRRAQLDYCQPCAVRELPAAVGVGPGSDLPASYDPPATP